MDEWPATFPLSLPLHTCVLPFGLNVVTVIYLKKKTQKQFKFVAGRVPAVFKEFDTSEGMLHRHTVEPKTMTITHTSHNTTITPPKKTH